MPTNNVISTADIRSGYTLNLAAGDSLVVTTGAGIYWTGNSALSFSNAADGNNGSKYVILGSVVIDVFSVGGNSAGYGSQVRVGTQGSVMVEYGLTLGSDGGNCNLINDGIISATGSRAC